MFRVALENITTYEAGKPIELVIREFGIPVDSVIKLASNENPYGTSPRVLESIRQNIHKAHLYPDDSMYELKEALSHHYNVQSDEIIIGAGSDQVIEFCLQAIDHHNACVLMAKTTFAMYEVYAKLAGVEILKTSSDTHCLNEFERIYQEASSKKRVSIVFLCVPNNPMGECLSAKEVEAFIKKVDKQTLVVLDGAYQEFAKAKDSSKGLDPAYLIEKYSNVIYLGTFSKAYGLGGMRVGYGIGSKRLIAMLHKVRPPFNITTLSLQAAIVALTDQDFVAQCVKRNFEQMQYYENFAKENHLDFIRSYTNFITLTNLPFDSTHLCDWLLTQGVILRNLKSYGLNAFRITIGMSSQNERVLELLKQYIQKNK